MNWPGQTRNRGFGSPVIASNSSPSRPADVVPAAMPVRCSSREDPDERRGLARRSSRGRETRCGGRPTRGSSPPAPRRPRSSRAALPARDAKASASGRVPPQELERGLVVAGHEAVADQERRRLAPGLRRRARRRKKTSPFRRRARCRRRGAQRTLAASVPEALATFTTRSARRPPVAAFDRRRASRPGPGRRSRRPSSARPSARARSAAAAPTARRRGRGPRADGLARGREAEEPGLAGADDEHGLARPRVAQHGRRRARDVEGGQRDLFGKVAREGGRRGCARRGWRFPRRRPARSRRGRRRSTRGGGESASATRARRSASPGDSVPAAGCRGPTAATSPSSMPPEPVTGFCILPRSRTIARDLVAATGSPSGGLGLAQLAERGRVDRQGAHRDGDLVLEGAGGRVEAAGDLRQDAGRIERAVEPERVRARPWRATGAGRRCGAARRSRRRSSSGSATTHAPHSGSSSRRATFSSPGTFAPLASRWTTKSCDAP